MASSGRHDAHASHGRSFPAGVGGGTGGCGQLLTAARLLREPGDRSVLGDGVLLANRQLSRRIPFWRRVWLAGPLLHARYAVLVLRSFKPGMVRGLSAGRRECLAAVSRTSIKCLPLAGKLPRFSTADPRALARLRISCKLLLHAACIVLSCRARLARLARGHINAVSRHGTLKRKDSPGKPHRGTHLSRKELRPSQPVRCRKWDPGRRMSRLGLRPVLLTPLAPPGERGWG